MDHGADGFRNIGAAYGDPLVLVAHCRERICAGGIMALKVCDVETQRYH